MSRRRPQRDSDARQVQGEGAEAAQLVQVYSNTGKDFKAKMMGSSEIGDYRGNTVIADTLSLLRKSTAKKSKVTINIKFKGLTVTDEKTKMKVVQAPIERVKFVCHDKQDVKVFAAVIQVPVSEGSFHPYKLYCFQAEKAVSVQFVHAANQMFKLLFQIMQSRRDAARATRRNSSSGAQSGRGATGGATGGGGQSSTSENTTEVADDTPVTLGFDIPPPPPSYTTAVSKKTASNYPVQNLAKPMPLAPPPSQNTVPSSIAKPRPRKRQQALPEPPPQPQAQQLDAWGGVQVSSQQVSSASGGAISPDLPDYSSIDDMQAQQAPQQMQNGSVAAATPTLLSDLPDYSTIEEMGGQAQQPVPVQSQPFPVTQPQLPSQQAGVAAGEVQRAPSLGPHETVEYCTIDEMNQMSNPPGQAQGQLQGGPLGQQIAAPQASQPVYQRQQQQSLIQKKQQRMQQELQSQQNAATPAPQLAPPPQQPSRQQQQVLIQQKQQQMQQALLAQQQTSATRDQELSQQISQKQQEQIVIQQQQQQALTRRLSQSSMTAPPPLQSKDVKKSSDQPTTSPPALPLPPKQSQAKPRQIPRPPLPPKDPPQDPPQQGSGFSPPSEPPPELPAKELKPRLTAPPPSSKRRGVAARNLPTGPPPPLPPKQPSEPTATAQDVPTQQKPVRTAQQDLSTQQKKVVPTLPPKQVTSRKFKELPPVPIENFLGHGIEENNTSSEASPPPEEQNIYDVPPSREPVPEGGAPSEQAKKEAVWEEWKSLETDLEDLAKDLGMEGDTSNNAGAARRKSAQETANTPAAGGAVGGASATPFDPEAFSTDPFGDSLFDSSFRTPSNSFAALPGVQAGGNADPIPDMTGDSGAFFESPNGWPPIGGGASGADAGVLGGATVGEGAASPLPWDDNAFSTAFSFDNSGGPDPFAQPTQQTGDASDFGFEANFDFSSSAQTPVSSSTTATRVSTTTGGFDANFDLTSPISTSAVAPSSTDVPGTGGANSFDANWGFDSGPSISPPPTSASTDGPPGATSQGGNATYSVINHVPPKTPSSVDPYEQDNDIGIYSLATEVLDEDPETNDSPNEQHDVYSVVNKIRLGDGGVFKANDESQGTQVQGEAAATGMMGFEADWNGLTTPTSAGGETPFNPTSDLSSSMTSGKADVNPLWAEQEQVPAGNTFGGSGSSQPSSPAADNMFEANWGSSTSQSLPSQAMGNFGDAPNNQPSSPTPENAFEANWGSPVPSSPGPVLDTGWGVKAPVAYTMVVQSEVTPLFSTSVERTKPSVRDPFEQSSTGATASPPQEQSSGGWGAESLSSPAPSSSVASFNQDGFGTSWPSAGDQQSPSNNTDSTLGQSSHGFEENWSSFGQTAQSSSTFSPSAVQTPKFTPSATENAWPGPQQQSTPVNTAIADASFNADAWGSSPPSKVEKPSGGFEADWSSLSNLDKSATKETPSMATGSVSPPSTEVERSSDKTAGFEAGWNALSNLDSQLKSATTEPPVIAPSGPGTSSAPAETKKKFEANWNALSDLDSQTSKDPPAVAFPTSSPPTIGALAVGIAAPPKSVKRRQSQGQSSFVSQGQVNQGQASLSSATMTQQSKDSLFSTSTSQKQDSFGANFSNFDSSSAQMSNPLYMSDTAGNSFGQQTPFPPSGGAFSPPSSASQPQVFGQNQPWSQPSQPAGAVTSFSPPSSATQPQVFGQTSQPWPQSPPSQPGTVPFSSPVTSSSATQPQVFGQTSQPWPQSGGVPSASHTSPPSSAGLPSGGITPPPKSSRSSRRKRHPSIEARPDKATLPSQNSSKSLTESLSGISLGSASLGLANNTSYKPDPAANVQAQTGPFGAPPEWGKSPTPPQNQQFPTSPPSQQVFGGNFSNPQQQQFGSPQGPSQQQQFGSPQGPSQQQQFGSPQGPPQQQQFPQVPPQAYGSAAYPPQQFAPPPPPQQGYPPQQQFGAAGAGGPSQPPQYPPTGQQQQQQQQWYPPPGGQPFGQQQQPPPQQMAYPPQGGYYTQPGYGPGGPQNPQGANMMPQQGIPIVPGGNFAYSGGPGGYPQQPQPPQQPNISPAPRRAPAISVNPSAFADLLPLALSPQKSKFKVKEEDKAVKSLMESRGEAKKFEKASLPTLNDLKTKNEPPQPKAPSGGNLLSFD